MKRSTQEGIDRYVNQGIPPGGFLEAVLSNDLKGALGRADEENRRDLFEIVQYCYMEIPSDCWGSAEKVSEWLKPNKRPSATGAKEEIMMMKKYEVPAYLTVEADSAIEADSLVHQALNVWTSQEGAVVKAIRLRPTTTLETVMVVE